MDQFDEYQYRARQTAIYPGHGSLKGLMYCGLGLAEEAGEVAGKVKRILRDHGGLLDDDQKQELRKELGDVLWYLSQVASEIGINMSYVARINLDKLEQRKANNTLHGTGDNR